MIEEHEQHMARKPGNVLLYEGGKRKKKGRGGEKGGEREERGREGTIIWSLV